MNRDKSGSQEIYDDLASKRKLFIEEFKDKLAILFPKTIKDGDVDLKALFEELGFASSVDNQESYTFTWPGKKASKMLADRPISSKRLKFFPEESKFGDRTENIYLEGDNLEVLKMIKPIYLGKIKCIYIDPPYNTGKDFVYKDNFISRKKTYAQHFSMPRADNQQVLDDQENRGRYHANWLSMIYPRLKLARDLLTEDGLIFISIDDKEQANLKKIADEIYGEENFISLFIWEKTQHFGRQKINCYSNAEYVLCYAKQLSSARGLKELLVEKIQEDFEDAPLYNASNPVSRLRFPAGTVRFNLKNGTYSKTNDQKYTLVQAVTVKNFYNSNDLLLEFRSRWSQRRVLEEIKAGTQFWIKSNKFAIRAVYHDKKRSTIAPKQILFTNNKNSLFVTSRFGFKIGTNETASREMRELIGSVVFNYPKPVSLIAYLISLCFSEDQYKDDFIVLDFFSGSATTAEAVMRLNATDGGKRKFIMVQLPEDLNYSYQKADKLGKESLKKVLEFLDNIEKPHLLTEIGKERIRRAGERIVNEERIKKSPKDLSMLDIGFKVFKVIDDNEYALTEERGEFTFFTANSGEIQEEG